MTGARLNGVDADREAQLLFRVIDTISAGLDLNRMLQGVATLVTETTATDVCFVHLLDEKGRVLRLRGASGSRLVTRLTASAGSLASPATCTCCRYGPSMAFRPSSTI